jgi:hypothetical protein
MVTLKPDADQIRATLDTLAKQDWVKRTERRWWPKFVFHYTDIRNAVQILQEGCLYSRKWLEDNGRLVVSSGSPSVLAGTNTDIKDCVRLYFRPKTPTQYYAEGICSQDTLSASRFPHAHCPVPIFFLFDSATVLSRADCCFSDTGLGAHNYQILSTASELCSDPQKPNPQVRFTCESNLRLHLLGTHTTRRTSMCNHLTFWRFRSTRRPLATRSASLLMITWLTPIHTRRLRFPFK